MSHTIAYPREECAEFLGRLKSTGGLLDTIKDDEKLYSILPMWIVAMLDYMKTRKLIRGIRAGMNACDADCEHAACLGTVLDIAKPIRDNYLRIYRVILESGRLSFFMKWITEKSLDGWDDLVEDCTAGSDEEFRSLIMKIAEKA